MKTTKHDEYDEYTDDPAVWDLVEIYEDYLSDEPSLRITETIARRIAELAADLEARGLLNIPAFERPRDDEADDPWPVRRVLGQLREKVTRDLGN